MIELSNFEVMGWEHVIRGMRNPMNSWDKSDSGFGCVYSDQHFCGVCEGGHMNTCPDAFKMFKLGPNDHDLMMKLRNAGSDHRKFMRMITVYVDINAPLYWWIRIRSVQLRTLAQRCTRFMRRNSQWMTLVVNV